MNDIVPEPLLSHVTDDGVLDLGGRQLGSVKVWALAQSFYLGNSPIRRLCLRNNRIDEHTAAELARALFSLKQLQDLDLSGNQLGTVGMAALSAYIGARPHKLYPEG